VGRGINYLHNLYQIAKMIQISSRLFIFLILGWLIGLHGTVCAQELLDKRVSLTIRESTLKSALDQISAKGGVTFTYGDRIANSNLKISVFAKDQTLRTLLTTAFKGKGLLFSVLEQEIYVRFETPLLKTPSVGQENSGQKYVISGTLSKKESGETLIGARVRVEGRETLSNGYGFYSIALPAGVYKLSVTSMGLKGISIPLELNKDTIMNLKLQEQLQTLETVVVHETRDVQNTQMGMERVNIGDIKHIPVLGGELDVVKTLQLLPGVTTMGEGSGGLFVRGGTNDQNKILLDEAPVYNATHLMGFFSTFNSDAIKNVVLYKSGMPAQYGGALSSVIDVKMNDGNNEKFGLSGGIGLISARLNVEGPVQRGRSSFWVSARRTYADLFLKLSPDSAVRNSSLYFYDINAKLNYILGNKDRLYISGYFGKDVFSSKDISGLNWGNATSTLRWNHIFNPKLFSNTSLIFSNYDYTVHYFSNQSSLDLFSQIRDWNLKQDMQWYISDRNTLSFGLNSVYHVIKPGEATAIGSAFISQKLQDRFSLDNALYASNIWKANNFFTLTYGLRLSSFTVLGKGDYYQVDDRGNVTATMSYKSGQKVVNYLNLEPRVSASLALNEMASFKASYVRNVQNLHLISNSSVTDPTDRWVASSNLIKPEVSDQVSLGYYKNMASNVWELSAELYYKALKNQIDYRNGVDLFTNRPIETLLLYGKGRAYGLELLLKKKTGRLTGWLGYTLSKSERKIDGINDNLWYNARQDRTHDITLVGLFQLNPKWTLSANWVFATGNAVTFPNVKYDVLGYSYYYFKARNADRMPSYHRLDLGITRSLKKTKGYSSDLNFSLYNAYGHKNAYRVVFRDDPSNPNQTEAVRITLFRFVPSVSYNFKF